MEKNDTILSLLKRHYPSAHIILQYENHWELLVAVMLSAQCTDITVNKVTRNLFPKYRSTSMRREIVNFSKVSIYELEHDIRSTGFYRMKAQHIQQSAQILLEKFNGKIPRTMDELLLLPGVARKTANIVLGNAYSIVVGIAVDTHVKRVSQRLGLTKQYNPDKIEKDLMQIFDKKDWFHLTYLLIEHGRKICNAKKPHCKQCFLNTICHSAYDFPHFKKNSLQTE
ncbi:MAG TPA: endonuclease III [Patescibacteria group bacterium]|nr:endonuclease III [Patescibacteria group bacterium]